jgi:hypothetical protein
MTHQTQKLTACESERLAYMAGDTATAELYARIDSLHRALGQAVATLEAVAELPTIKHARGAAAETLATIGQNFNLWDIEDSTK